MNRNCIFFLALLFVSCEKEVQLDLPQVESRIVVEGRIEMNQAPYVLLTKSAGYFDPVDTNYLKSLIVNNALVIVSDAVVSDTLKQLPGTPVYFSLNPKITGTPGTTYYLNVIAEGKTYTSYTTIPPVLNLDSVWFKPQPPSDSLGFIWAVMNDPSGFGNAYRWFAKRIGKDDDFIAPIGSAFDDEFIEGKRFEFAYNRGRTPNSDKPDDTNGEAGYFKQGDTIVVKFCTIDKRVYEFIRSYETQVVSNGNPFASPVNLKTNMEGGALGLWAGYGISLDTVIAK